MALWNLPMTRQQELLQQNDVEVVGLTVGANPEEDEPTDSESTFCCYCLESFDDNNVESICSECGGPIHAYDCVWDATRPGDCRRRQADQQRTRRRSIRRVGRDRRAVVPHFDPIHPSPHAQLELTLAVMTNAMGYSGLALEWLRALAALAPSWNSILAAFATYKATGVLQEGAQSTSKAIQRTVDAGAARVEETIEVAAEEVQKVVRGVGTASVTVGTTVAVLTALYFLRLCSVGRCGRRARKLCRKFIWPSPYAHRGAQERGRESPWATVARQAVSRGEPIDDSRFRSLEETARSMLHAAAPRLGATVEISQEPKGPDVALKGSDCLGPPSPALDDQGRPEPREYRWGLEFKPDQALPFWTALKGKTVSFVYPQGSRAGKVRSVLVEQYDATRSHIRTLDPGAPTGSSRNYNIRYLLNLQVEGGQRPGLRTTLRKAAGCLAGVVPAAEPWHGPMWGAIRSRLRTPQQESVREGGEAKQALALADQAPPGDSRGTPALDGLGAPGELSSVGRGCFVECTSAYPTWPPAQMVFDESIEPTMLRALEGRHSVSARLYSLDHPRYGDALRKIRENHPKGSVRILLDTSNFECPSCSGQTSLLSTLFAWGVELRHVRPVSHAFSYMHEKAWLFGSELYAFGSANSTMNSTGRCEENCGFFSIKSVVDAAVTRFEEGWERASRIDASSLADVERCKERRRSKSASRARSQSAARAAIEESRCAGGASVPERFNIGSVPPTRSCPEIGSTKGQPDGSGASRWREDSRSGDREMPPRSLPPATRRAGPASARAASALGSLPETQWSDARSRGRSSAHSQGS